MRTTDVVARLGGDEFAVVLPRCDLDEAEDVADAIARAIRMHTPPGEAAPPLTASIGVATFGPRSESYDTVLSAADNAMYEAKRAGRDSVRVAGQAVPWGAVPVGPPLNLFDGSGLSCRPLRSTKKYKTFRPYRDRPNR